MNGGPLSRHTSNFLQASFTLLLLVVVVVVGGGGVKAAGEAFNDRVNKCRTYGALHHQGHHFPNKHGSSFRTGDVCFQQPPAGK